MRFEYPNLVVEYDPEAEALYIYLSEEVGSEKVSRPVEGVNVDLGPDGHVVGVEVLL